MSQPQPVIEQAPTAPRFVTGLYRVFVERLDARGEAQARVVQALRPVSLEDLARVYHLGDRPAPEPSEFSFIGGMPCETLDIEARWTLPRPDRRPSRRIPAPAVRVTRVVDGRDDRVSPPCPLFGACGGCQFQHMAYPAQLRWKTERVRDALVAHGLDDSVVSETVGCEQPWRYRNHMRFSVNREGRAGLTERSGRRVIEIEECHIAHPAVGVALAAVRDQTLPRPQLVVRVGDDTGDIMLQPPATSPVRERLQAAGLRVCDAEMDERLLGVPFRIRPSSFFQTNTAQANKMASIVLGLLPTGPEVSLVDAYSGVGVFAALMAGRAGKVVAIEESASSIRDARWNLRSFPNVEILQAKVEDALPRLSGQLDGLVIDPPRAGCQRIVLDTLIACRVPRVVYVSCNPETLARDLALLTGASGAYRMVSAQPLDMFPQTAHIETIVALEANV